MEEKKCPLNKTVNEIAKTFGDDNCKGCERINCSYLIFSDGMLTCEIFNDSEMR